MFETKELFSFAYRSQFHEMFSALGYSSVEELAKSVLTGGDEERLQILDKMYSKTDPALSQIVDSLRPQQQETTAVNEPNKGKKSKNLFLFLYTSQLFHNISCLQFSAKNAKSTEQTVRVKKC